MTRLPLFHLRFVSSPSKGPSFLLVRFDFDTEAIFILATSRGQQRKAFRETVALET